MTVQPSVLAVITVQQEHTGLMALDVCNVLRVISEYDLHVIV